jgi:hypothetical protein
MMFKVPALFWLIVQRARLVTHRGVVCGSSNRKRDSNAQSNSPRGRRSLASSQRRRVNTVRTVPGSCSVPIVVHVRTIVALFPA